MTAEVPAQSFTDTVYGGLLMLALLFAAVAVALWLDRRANR